MRSGEKGFKQLRELLPEGWEEKAKELGALQRARQIKTPEELLRLNLLYLTEGKSMAGTSALTNLLREATTYTHSDSHRFFIVLFNKPTLHLVWACLLQKNIFLFS